jgi:hypothetical protein
MKIWYKPTQKWLDYLKECRIKSRESYKRMGLDLSKINGLSPTIKR